MDVGRADEQDRQGVLAPVARVSGDELEGDEDGERPDLRGETKEEALVDLLREPGPEEQLDDEENVGWNAEQVGLERGEVERTELQREICGDGLVRNQPCESNDIDGPHVPIRDAVVKLPEAQRLTVVHVALRRVVPKDTVRQDLFFMLVKPAFVVRNFLPEAFLIRRWRQIKPRDDTDDAGNQAL